MKKEVAKEVKEQVKEVKAELKAEVKQEVGRQVQALVKEKGQGKGKQGFEDLAYRQVAFLGLPDNTAEQRLQELSDFVKRFAAAAPPSVSLKYKGPRNNRVVTNTGLATFTDSDARDRFLKDSKGVSFVVQGKEVRVVKAKTKTATERDWILLTAKDLLTREATGKSVQVKDRTVTVNEEVAFEQEKHETRGSFVGDFKHLSLP